MRNFVSILKLICKDILAHITLHNDVRKTSEVVWEVTTQNPGLLLDANSLMASFMIFSWQTLSLITFTSLTDKHE